jgi:hypothetical protein
MGGEILWAARSDQMAQAGGDGVDGRSASGARTHGR